MGGRGGREPLDDIERAHLRDPNDTRFTISRYDPSADLADLVRRYWVPVWTVPGGEVSPQRVLQYPVCLLVVASGYARFYGPTTGVSSTVLSGTGWAVGALLQPAAGSLLTGRAVSELTDRFVDCDDVPALGAEALVASVHEAMSTASASTQSHLAAIAHVEGALRRVVPVDDEGRLVNHIVELVEETPELVRVDDLCQRLGMAERPLQRLLKRRVGLGPKWLIRRRRLHEAAARLRDRTSLAAVAADLGYADQAHFTRDFRRSTGLTPGEFASRFS
jgi:AraC-like DNA-binding protein